MKEGVKKTKLMVSKTGHRKQGDQLAPPPCTEDRNQALTCSGCHWHLYQLFDWDWAVASGDDWHPWSLFANCFRDTDSSRCCVSLMQHASHWYWFNTAWLSEVWRCAKVLSCRSAFSAETTSSGREDLSPSCVIGAAGRVSSVSVSLAGRLVTLAVPHML